MSGPVTRSLSVVPLLPGSASIKPEERMTNL